METVILLSFPIITFSMSHCSPITSPALFSIRPDISLLLRARGGESELMCDRDTHLLVVGDCIGLEVGERLVRGREGERGEGVCE